MNQQSEQPRTWKLAAGVVLALAAMAGFAAYVSSVGPTPITSDVMKGTMNAKVKHSIATTCDVSYDPKTEDQLFSLGCHVGHNDVIYQVPINPDRCVAFDAGALKCYGTGFDLKVQDKTRSNTPVINAGHSDTKPCSIVLPPNTDDKFETDCYNYYQEGVKFDGVISCAHGLTHCVGNWMLMGADPISCVGMECALEW
jgi:hypothetical protein|uniref:Uncharacterized protein n=1 Tax=Fibrocapsa japonica TaxID=94617 RepID=A0A7S2UVR0_9STRA|mmetsp:Transcript_15806/g.23234  ORF Transcript_15806/g.23234 Transcript_15806/m.23234 type:complete len:198 (+) Transcript_15806:142-735(+)|eukprot:CAMPEP_0113941138 /NCGR_PEP_ID=MMETSP1339-20121228/7121_1 /TAXON_ID=94617 /ORGANISM="Fibrocapsa japonica" /LENGTH=197 /DNA_ID=CAMNT_0000945201 /DNA_START=142 /DNA_END=732 /DNA_ORIENTATION=- /assembly_acc=CAM_ASM_000762